MSDQGVSNRLTLAYIAPFLTFILLMTVERSVGLPAAWFYPIRFFTILVLLVTVSRPAISFRASAPLASIGVGIAVLVIWIGPDLLFGAGYRRHWLFSNSLVGAPITSLSPELLGSFWFLMLRSASCAITVPILEELFWRGWLMRWLIQHEFAKIPVGTYSRTAFWIVAILFASEHGSYWEVGLVTGVIYNWWCIRTKNLADCILAHAVTNALLSAYVVYTGRFEYWL